jgi:hypothetical protein
MVDLASTGRLVASIVKLVPAIQANSVPGIAIVTPPSSEKNQL